MPGQFEIGLDTFGDVTRSADGTTQPQARVLRDVVEPKRSSPTPSALDAFGVGEHHRRDFSISAPEVLLAAIAGRTQRIVLGSAVTVLSTDDPVRVFQRFSTLNAVSDGRAEVILGRGSFTESYPLFGYDLSRYSELFEDKLSLFARAAEAGAGDMVGIDAERDCRHDDLSADRARPAQDLDRGRRNSGVRRARGAIRPAAHAGDHRRQPPCVSGRTSTCSSSRSSNSARRCSRSRSHSPGHVAATDEQARTELWPHYQAMINRIGAERGWPPASREQFEHEAGPDGALYAGSPETVAAKIVKTARLLGLSRFNLKYSAGTLSHETMMQSIELIGTRVAPLVREQLAQ